MNRVKVLSLPCLFVTLLAALLLRTGGTQAVEVLGSPESNGAIEPTQMSNNTGALQRAYAALYGDNEKERIEGCLQVNGMQWVRSTGYIEIWNRLQAADQEMIALLPKETVEADADRTIPNYPSLDQVYNLSGNVQGVIFALIFGFLPSLVITSLQKEAALMMGQLKSTDPGEDGAG